MKRLTLSNARTIFAAVAFFALPVVAKANTEKTTQTSEAELQVAEFWGVITQLEKEHARIIQENAKNHGHSEAAETECELCELIYKKIVADNYRILYTQKFNAVLDKLGKLYLTDGDSKIFIIRKGEMASVVKEHNYLMVLNYRLKNGQITMKEYERELAYGAGLISYIGMGNLSLIDSNREPFQLADHDIILLCSDGLTNALTEEQILSIIMENPGNPGYIHNRLQDEAEYASDRGQDNTSIVTLYYRTI